MYVNYVAPDALAAQYKIISEVNPQDLQWIPHHYLNYYPNPNYRKGLTYHNSLGYRDREFSIEKQEGVFRIVALGGSTTYTIGVQDNEKTFTRILEKMLIKNFGYENIEVINAGVGGYNSWESLINLQFRVLDLHPDIIIIYHGTNDVHARLVLPNSYTGDNSGRRKQWIEPKFSLLVEYSYLLRAISKHLNFGLFESIGLGSFVNAPTYQGQGSLFPSDEPIFLLEKNPPVFFRRNLINMVAIARAHGVKVILSTWAYSPNFGDYASTSHYRRGFEENNVVVEDVAREYGVTLFDFARKMPSDKIYWADGRHVNEEGARVKAELFADFIHRSGFLMPAQPGMGHPSVPARY
jgi:lysophospholipase L1-like esterase